MQNVQKVSIIVVRIFQLNNFYSMFSGNTGDKECEAYIEECRNAVEELGKKAETDANYKYKFREASQTLENMENCLNYVRKVNEPNISS